MNVHSSELARWSRPSGAPRCRIVLYAWWAPAEIETVLAPAACPEVILGEAGCSRGVPDPGIAALTVQ